MGCLRSETFETLCKPACRPFWHQRAPTDKQKSFFPATKTDRKRPLGQASLKGSKQSAQRATSQVETRCQNLDVRKSASFLALLRGDSESRERPVNLPCSAK